MFIVKELRRSYTCPRNFEAHFDADDKLAWFSYTYYRVHKYIKLNHKEAKLRVCSEETQKMNTYDLDLGVFELPLTATLPVSFMSCSNAGLLLVKAIRKSAET